MKRRKLSRSVGELAVKKGVWKKKKKKKPFQRESERERERAKKS